MQNTVISPEYRLRLMKTLESLQNQYSNNKTSSYQEFKLQKIQQSNNETSQEVENQQQQQQQQLQSKKIKKQYQKCYQKAQCPQCNRVLINKYTLKTHFQKFHKNFQCKLCCDQFATFQQLECHIQSEHQDHHNHQALLIKSEVYSYDSSNESYTNNSEQLESIKNSIRNLTQF